MSRIASMFEYLNPVSRTVWEGLGGMALLEGGVSLGAGFELSKDLNHPVFCLCRLLVAQDVSSQLFLHPGLCSIIMDSDPLKP